MPYPLGTAARIAPVRKLCSFHFLVCGVRFASNHVLFFLPTRFGVALFSRFVSSPCLKNGAFCMVLMPSLPCFKAASDVQLLVEIWSPAERLIVWLYFPFRPSLAPMMLTFSISAFVPAGKQLPNRSTKRNCFVDSKSVISSAPLP